MHICKELIISLAFLSELQLAVKFVHDGRFIETEDGRTFLKCQSNDVKTQGVGPFYNCPMEGCNNRYQSSIQNSCKSETCKTLTSQYRFGCDHHHDKLYFEHRKSQFDPEKFR
ncbi:hypothetical protein PGTUg99_030180 [Puccinia graminis f. sp. tritici]|uniref:CxC6 like cysteine cluster associated with KDZ domain-containing protein n=1 Tax=Puccinia graminis f. sp. tritici TaxID=56615 RepID=A0A5B0RUP8_PUCGR|nr:hypothetical protein PGTUg99_030180 [Puccinia graminis f. sp. tritici]